MNKACEEAVRDYLELQEKAKEIKAKMEKAKQVIVERIKKEGRPIIFQDKRFIVKERVSYKYNPKKLRRVVDGDVVGLLLKEEVDVKRLQGLIKVGIIAKEDVEKAKEVSRTVEALVVEKLKG